MEKKWSSTRIPENGKEYLCIATFLPVRRWRDVIPFIRLSMRIEEQIRKSSGAVRYGLKTNIPRKHFWTLSVWDSRAAVNAFVGKQPHATAVQRFEHWAGKGAAFVEWKSSNPEVAWPDAFTRLQNPTFYYQGSEGQQASAPNR